MSPIATQLLRIIRIFLTVLSLSATMALAQDAPKVAADPKASKKEVVAVESVSEQAVQTTTLLETLDPSEKSYEALSRFKAETDRLLLDIEVRLAGIQTALGLTPKVRSLQGWEADLRSLLRSLETLGKGLDTNLDELRKALEQVDANAAQWKTTKDKSVSTEVSSAVRNRIDATLSALDQTREKLSAQRNELLTLRDRLVDPRTSLNRTIKKLETTIQDRLGGLLKRDRPTLWNAQLNESIRYELKEGGSEPLVEQWLRFKNYVREHISMIAFQAVVFLVMAIGLRLLGSRAKELVKEDYDLHHASLIFALPTSMALVITLSLTSLLNPLAPYLFELLAYSLLAIPAALIVSRLLSAAMSPVVWALLIVYLVDRLRDILDTLPALERTVFLVELIGAVAILWWLRRPQRIVEIPPDERREPIFRVVRGLTGTAITLLAVATIAEVAGYGDLADLIGSGTLRSAYSALFIFAFLKVLQSLIAYALILRPLRLLRMVSSHRELMRQRIETLLRWLAFVFWAYLTLAYFGLDMPLKTGAVSVISAELRIGSLAISLGDVLVLVFTIWLTFALARLIDFILTQDVFPRVNLPRGVPYAIVTLTKYILIFIGFLFALAAAGIELSKLTIVAGGLGVGIGFGLQNIVNNFFSGLILLFERPLQVGDDIQLGSENGEIGRIGIRSTSIQTRDGAEVIVPNSKLISEVVTNWTLLDRRRRIEVSVVVNSEIDAEQVIEVLLEVVRGHSSILRNPPPRAYCVNLGESKLEFVLRIWIAEFRDESATRSDLNASLQKALAKAGIVEPLRTIDIESLTEPRDQI